MSDKSYVTMEQHQCIVCGHLFDTGALLLDKRLKKTFERHTVTGNGLCPEHQKLFDDGYIAFVEISNETKSSTLQPEEACRTGRIAHVRRAVAADMFNVPIGNEPLAFVEKDVIDFLEKIQHPDDRYLDELDSGTINAWNLLYRR